jgi:hypothetical protein
MKPRHYNLKNSFCNNNAQIMSPANNHAMYLTHTTTHLLKNIFTFLKMSSHHGTFLSTPLPRPSRPSLQVLCLCVGLFLCIHNTSPPLLVPTHWIIIYCVHRETNRRGEKGSRTGPVFIASCRADIVERGRRALSQRPPPYRLLILKHITRLPALFSSFIYIFVYFSFL